MSENFTVASLDANINIKIPREKIDKFKQDLKEIQDTLEHVVKQMANMGSVVERNFKSAGKHLKFQNVQQKEALETKKRQSKEDDKQHSNAKRTSKVWGEWVNKLAQIRVLTGLISHYLASIAKLVLVPTAALAGFTYLAARINGTTTEMANLSEATGFSINDMRALGLEAKKLGFNFENVNSTVEELNNKMGGEGVAPETGLREGLEAFNLTVEDMRKLKPAQQLAQIMNAAMRLKKAGKPLADLSSAFDKIFGGEGNRMYTSFLQSMEKGNVTWENFIRNARQYTDLSGEAVSGAKSFTGAFNAITESLKSVSAEFFGIFGKKLEPYFNSLLTGFTGLSDAFASILDPLSDAMVDTFIEAFGMVVEVLDWLKERPVEVAIAIDTLISGLKTMFKVGVDLAKILSALIPVINGLLRVFGPILEFISSLLASDFVRYLITAAGAIMGVYYAGMYLIAGLGVVILKMITFSGLVSGIIGTISAAALALKAFFTIGAGAGAAGMLLVFGKILAIVAAVSAALYGLYKLTEWGSDLLSDVLASGDIEREVNIQKNSEAQTKAAIERMHANRANLAQGSIGTGSSSTDNSSKTSIINTSVTNHNFVQDPTTGKEFMEKVVNGKPY